jgi:hypothetical protein
MTEKNNDNLAVRVSSDPILLKTIFTRLKDPQYHIDDKIEAEITALNGIKSTDKGVLVSKVTTPDDYQTQLTIIAAVQHCLDRVHDINTMLYGLQHRYKEIYNKALKVITLNYFNELNELKDGVRKTVISVALQPIQEGLDRLEYLIDLGESAYKHLTATNWNVKEGTEIIRDYLSLLKFPTHKRI